MRVLEVLDIYPILEGLHNDTLLPLLKSTLSVAWFSKSWDVGRLGREHSRTCWEGGFALVIRSGTERVSLKLVGFQLYISRCAIGLMPLLDENKFCLPLGVKRRTIWIRK